MPSSRLVLAAIILVWTTVLASVAVAIEPQELPASIVVGDSIVVADLGFSISAPSSGWKWFSLSRKPRNYQAVNSTTGEYFNLMIDQSTKTALNDEFMRGYFTALKQEAAESGIELSAPAFKPSGIPVPGSYRASYWLGLPSGRQFREAFIVRGDNFYVIERTSADPGDSPAFLKFVASFKLLEKQK